MQCPNHNEKVNRPGFHGASYHLGHPTSEYTKNSTYQYKWAGSKCSLWGMKMTTTTKLVESVFIPYMSASVTESRKIGSCSSSGLCAGLDLGHKSPFSAATHHSSFWQRLPVRGYQNNFQEPVLLYRLSMFCQNCVTCRSIPTDPGIPPLGYSTSPRTWV